MAGQNKIQIILEVDDKGSATIKKFDAETNAAFNKIKSGAQTSASGVSKANQEMANSIKKSTGGISGSLGKLKTAWLGIGAAVAAVIAFGKKAIDAYMEQEKATMKLAVAMRNQGDYSRKSLRELKAYASQLQKTTVYGDELTLSVMGNLKTYGMNTEELKKATIATMDLATAKGMDLLSASDLVGKAFVGETGTLSRYGIVLEKGVPKTKKFAAVLKLINERFGGAAQAEIETYSGQLKQMSNWWGDIMEKIGFGLLKALEAAQFGVGLLVSGFLGGLELMTKGLSKLYSWGEKIPIIGKHFSGLKKDIDLDAASIESAKNATLEFTSKNYKMLTSFNKVEDAVERMGKGTKDTTNKIKELTKEQKKMIEDRIKLGRELELALMSEKERAIDAMNKKVEAFRKAGLNEIKIQEYISQEKEKIEQTYTEKAQKQYDALVAAWRKANVYKVDATKKTVEEELKATENAINQQEAFYRDLFYKTGQYAEEYTFLRKLQLDIEIDKLRVFIKDETALMKMKNQMLMQIESERLTRVASQNQSVWSDISSTVGISYDTQKRFADLAYNANVAKLASTKNEMMALGMSEENWKIWFNASKAKAAIQIEVDLSLARSKKTWYGMVNNWVSAVKGSAEDWTRYVSESGSSFSSGIFASIGALMNPILAMVQAVKGVIAFVKEAVNIIPDVLNAAADVFGSIANLGKNIREAMKAFIDGFIDAMLNLSDIVIAIHDAVIMFILRAPEIITAIIDNVPRMFTALLEGVPRFITAIVDATPRIIDAIIQGIPRMISAIIKSIPQIVTALVEAIAKAPIKMAESIGSGIGDIFKPVGDIFRGVGDFFGDIFGGLFHQGGIIKAHQGIYIHPSISAIARPPLYAHSGLSLAPDERLIIGQTGEGILPRPSMRKLGTGNFETLRTGNFEVGKGSGGKVENHYHIGKLVAIEGDNHVFDDRFIEKLTRKVRVELKTLAELRH